MLNQQKEMIMKIAIAESGSSIERLLITLDRDIEITRVHIEDCVNLLESADYFESDLLFIEYSQACNNALLSKHFSPPKHFPPILIYCEDEDSYAKVFENKNICAVRGPCSERSVLIALVKSMSAFYCGSYENHLNGLFVEQTNNKSGHRPVIDRLVLRDATKIRLIRTSDIRFVRAAGSYVEIHLINNQTILHRALLKDIEEKLQQAPFTRIHRSFIVRSDLISELRTIDGGAYKIKIEGGEEFTLPRSNKQLLDFWEHAV
jgi:hypothetical protein